MRRASSKERARSRTLNDDELRAVWKATAQGTFGALVRFLLLTSARRSEASEMTWGELEGSTWALPATRDKVSVGIVRPLSKAAYAILKALPRNGAYVFAADGAPMTGFSSRKKQLDAESGVTGWTIHDLRRTARSLMSRAAVPSDHAELCLGHALPGIRATYDRHSYHAEKAAALQALAEQVMGIVG
jgi:integrase